MPGGDSRRLQCKQTGGGGGPGGHCDKRTRLCGGATRGGLCSGRCRSCICIFCISSGSQETPPDGRGSSGICAGGAGEEACGPGTTIIQDRTIIQSENELKFYNAVTCEQQILDELEKTRQQLSCLDLPMTISPPDAHSDRSQTGGCDPHSSVSDQEATPPSCSCSTSCSYTCSCCTSSQPKAR